MKLTGLIAILFLLCLAGCAVPQSSAPDDIPDELVHMASATVLTPGLEAAKRGIVFYPTELYSSGVSGRVKVSLEMNKVGEVTMAQVVESTEQRFEVAAIKGALKWQFKPGPRKGEILFDFVSPNPVHDDKPGKTIKEDPGSFEGDYILVANADVKPKLTVSAVPKFPYRASQQNLNGSVSFAFIISATGETTQIRVIKATNADFAESIVAAVAKWRFSPAIKNGKPVACLVQQTSDFNLDK